MAAAVESVRFEDGQHRLAIAVATDLPRPRLITEVAPCL